MFQPTEYWKYHKITPRCMDHTGMLWKTGVKKNNQTNFGAFHSSFGFFVVNIINVPINKKFDLKRMKRMTPLWSSDTVVNALHPTPPRHVGFIANLGNNSKGNAFQDQMTKKRQYWWHVATAGADITLLQPWDQRQQRQATKAAKVDTMDTTCLE